MRFAIPSPPRSVLHPKQRWRRFGLDKRSEYGIDVGVEEQRKKRKLEEKLIEKRTTRMTETNYEQRRKKQTGEKIREKTE